jgi:hypothetical protein
MGKSWLNVLASKSTFLANIESIPRLALNDVIVLVKKLLDRIPRTIDMTLPDINAEFKKQLEKAKQDDPKQSWRRTRKVADSISGKSKKRFGAQELITPDKNRVLLPLYSFFVLESRTFNKKIEKLKSFLNTLCEWNHSEDDNEYDGNIFEIAHALQCGHVPSIITGGVSVPIDCWVQELTTMRDMIITWLSTGRCDSLELRYISSPEALFHSLQEQYSALTNNSMHELRVNFKVALLDQTDFDLMTLEDDDEVDCKLTVGGISFRNAKWNFETSCVEPLNNAQQGSIAQVVKLVVAVKKHDPLLASFDVLRSDDKCAIFSCPLNIILSSSRNYNYSDCRRDDDDSLNERQLLTIPLKVKSLDDADALRSNMACMHTNLDHYMFL